MRTQTHSQSSSGSGSGQGEKYEHIPVLLHEVIDGLALKGNECVVDGTLGLGGHAVHVLSALGTEGIFIGLDKDGAALARAEQRIGEQKARCIFSVSAFESLADVLTVHKIGKVDRILLDLGWGSHTLKSGRGFSFMVDEPLLMTYEDSLSDETLTARDIVNTWSEETLASIIFGWGEESFGRRIAAALVAARAKKPIETTGELASIIEKVVPRRGKVHPATKTFQALRIAVNNELTHLEATLKNHIRLLTPGGRLAVITFHSLEDRIVKHVFRELVQEGMGNLLTKRPQQASETELKENPRSRSAKLRIFITTV